MKRIILLLLITALFLCGCAPSYRTDATAEQIAAVYKDAGYDVSFRNFSQKTDDGIVGYVQADHENGEFIYFAIFDSESAAEDYVSTMGNSFWDDIVAFFGGEESSVYMDSYGCIVVSYTNEDHFTPFESLLVAA